MVPDMDCTRTLLLRDSPEIRTSTCTKKMRPKILISSHKDSKELRSYPADEIAPPVNEETALEVLRTAEKNASGTAKTNLNRLIDPPPRVALRAPFALNFSVLGDDHELMLLSSERLLSDIV
jgi:hypothetical protein